MRQLPSNSDIPMHGWTPYADMHRERIRAHEKHVASGGSMETEPWDNTAKWLPVLGEEFGEVARVICEFKLGNISHDQFRFAIREELIQLGAMAAAWVDATDDVT